MKIITLIARLLLGLVFVIFGLNGFLNFIPASPPPGLAGQFFQVLIASHYHYLVFAIQLIGGVLLLTNQFVPLALTLLAPVLVNILNFHITMNPSGLALGAVCTIFWLIVAYSVRTAFLPLLANTAPTS
jgi:putative oxidoreductase